MTPAPDRQALEDSFARHGALLDEWVDLGRQIAALEARRVEVLATRLDLVAREREMHSSPDEVAFRSMIAEHAAAGHLPPGTAEVSITDAWVLARLYPATLAALASGAISRRHADVLMNEAPNLSGVADAEAIRAEYEAQVLPFAENDTAARSRAHARGVAARLCPESQAEQHRRARSERSVTVRPDGEGMAVLTAILPEILAYAVHDRLTTMARALTQARPEGQRRPTRAALRALAMERAAAMSAEEPSDPEPPLEPHFLPSDASERAPWDHSTPDSGSASESGPAPEPGSASEPGSVLEPVSASEPGSVPEPGSASESGSVPEPVEGSEPIDGPFDSSDMLPDPSDRESYDAAFFESTPLDDTFGATDADTRSLDQLRADILADLLLTTMPSTIQETSMESMRATVHVTVAATTLAGADDRFAELEGHGPIEPEFARTLAGYSSSWARLFLDPQGMAIETDNYVPTASMKRFLRTRDQHCRFPGCRAPAHRCQIDHNHDHAKGGRTALCNLSLFCAGHHALKHPDLDDRDRWTARQLDGGVILWTSPLGRHYTDEPPLRVMFT